MLRAIAERQASKPDELAKTMPPPTGLAAADTSPLGLDAPAIATKPLSDVLNSIPALQSAVDAVQSDPADPELVVESMKLYASGREKLAAGKAAAALTDLEKAARLNPGSAQVQRTLGDAHAAAGRRSSAITAYEKAVGLGLKDPELFGILGRELARTKRFDRAMPMLKAACEDARANSDPVRAAVAGVDLAEAMLAQGYVSAGRELLVTSLMLLPEAPPAIDAQDVADVYRRRAELWQRAGDLSLRLNDSDSALAAYERAAAFPTVDPVALVPRRIHACLRAGRSAQAALVLLSDIERVKGRIEDRHLSTLSLLATDKTVSGPLASAVGEMARNPSFEATPSVLGRLARASAACVAPAEARKILEARLGAVPTDADAAASLFAAFGADSAGGVAAACRLIEVAPDQTDMYAEVLIRRGTSLGAQVKRLEEQKDQHTQALLLGAMLRRLGRPAEGFDVIKRVTFPAAMKPAAIAMAAMCAASCGRWEVAIAERDACVAMIEPRPARNLADAQISVQRFPEALAAIAEALEPGSMKSWRGVADDLMAAELSLRAGEPKKAEAFLLNALAADKFDERAYDALFDLYSARAPLADDAKLSSLAKSLRDNIPSSKVARGIVARELMSRAQWDQARDALCSMVDADTESVTTLSLLAVAWENQIKLDASAGERAEAWVRDRLKGREDSPVLTILLARVLAARGKAEEAEQMLAARWQEWPMPEFGKMREYIVREAMKDPQKAARMTCDRLGGIGRDIDASIEYATAQLESGDIGGAVSSLTAGLPEAVPLTPAQSSRIAGLVTMLKPEEMIKLGVRAESEAALKLFDLVSARKIELPAQAYMLRVLILCAGHSGETDRLFAAVEDAAAKTKEPRLRVIARIAMVLLAKDDPSDAIGFLKAATLKAQPFDEGLAFEWVRQVCLRGGGEHMRQLVESGVDLDAMLKIVESLAGNQESGQEPQTTKQKQAEILYCIANLASVQGREKEAEEGYRLALEFDPGHAWTLNNLGYLVLERGDNIDEAERMIAEAYKTLSHQASVIDSLGWVRYKRGVFKDTQGPNGQIRGAVSLLREAVSTAARGENYEQADHLGDAYWRAGNVDEARKQWLKAQSLLTYALANANLGGPEEQSPARKRYTEYRDSVQAKLTALRDGKDPAVAPTQAELDAKRNTAPQH
ncbi:MAG: hypothetical protein JSR77_05240 [Planctomycetes bacterium]|nr:hypothetical protein [Planctomycetota bacterium]